MDLVKAVIFLSWGTSSTRELLGGHVDTMFGARANLAKEDKKMYDGQLKKGLSDVPRRSSKIQGEL